MSEGRRYLSDRVSYGVGLTVGGIAAALGLRVLLEAEQRHTRAASRRSLCLLGRSGRSDDVAGNPD